MYGFEMRKCPLLQPVNKAGTGGASFSKTGKPNLDKDGKLKSEDTNQKNDISARHFLFDGTLTTLDRSRTVIPPLRSDYHRSANLRPFGPSEGLSRSYAGRPFTLSHTKRWEVKPSPVLPPLLVIKGTKLSPKKDCKPNGPKRNNSTHTPSTHTPVTGKDNQKPLTYPDPMIGAPLSFMHRMSQLSSLQDAMVRQEGLKKLRKSKKPTS